MSRRARGGAAVVVAALLMLAACGTRSEWQRPDTEPLVTQNDLNQCWDKAIAALPYDRPPFQQQPSFGLVPGAGGHSATSGAIVIPDPAPVGADVSVLQQRTQLVDKCMRGNGYTAK